MVFFIWESPITELELEPIPFIDSVSLNTLAEISLHGLGFFILYRWQCKLDGSILVICSAFVGSIRILSHEMTGNL